MQLNFMLKKETMLKINQDNINEITKLRMNVRNFLLVATNSELKGELKLSIERKDFLRAYFVQELIEEAELF